MTRAISDRPKRTGAEVTMMVEAALQQGMDPEQAERVMIKARMSDHLMEIYDVLDGYENPYLTPNNVPSGVIIHEGVKPKFFEQTDERELTEKCDLSTYHLEPHPKDSMIPPNNFDASYGLLLDFNKYFAPVGLGAKGSLADQLGLELLRDRRGNNPMMLECTGSPTRSHEYQWYTDTIYKYRDFPHLMVKSLHQVTKDGTEKKILRSELMILVRLIVLKGRRDEKKPHAIIPVLLISIRPYQYVVIEAYYDGKNVHVNYGEPIVMSEQVPPKEQDKRMKSVLGWAAAKPCGKTTSYIDSPQ